ncbi:hypothetical protein PLUTE_a0240 [Pseudoalteromonas luteoviolacea DSM 6061]|nr:hypothetical protein [Pseudoalteromonas luteoviolacea DSM 6061]
MAFIEFYAAFKSDLATNYKNQSTHISTFVNSKNRVMLLIFIK